MKLIDILVDELPKRGGWPEDAAFVAQEEGGELWSFISKPHKDCYDEWMDESSSGYHNKVGKLPEASDHDTSAITREQYEAALAAKNDGWIDWHGGECPVLEGVLVEVKYRNEKNYHIKGVNRAGRWPWAHYGTDGDIIAYRPHQPKEAEQAKADDEDDLNECIGQATAPLWNGEGLPPVGYVCERSWAGDEWLSCEILFASNQIVVVKLKESGMEDAYNIGDVTFRPIRTEAERNRDEAIEEMIKIATMYTTKSLGLDLAFNSIYNSIAAGEIPGVKLED